MASAEDDSEDGEDTQDQSMSADPSAVIPSYDDDTEDSRQDYSSLFRLHVNATRSHLCGESDKESIEDDEDHVDDGWTSSEKNLFFHALLLYSRWRPDLIASSISTKSTTDVSLYIDRLEEASSYSQPEDDTPLSREDFPCSHEMSKDWIEREEYEARVYAAYEIDAEERDKLQRREGKRSPSPSRSPSSRPAKRRKVSLEDDVDEDGERELAWAREDQFQHLDTWVLKRMAYLLNVQNDGCALGDEDEDDVDLDLSTKTRPTLSPFPSSSQSTSRRTLTPQISLSLSDFQPQSMSLPEPQSQSHRPSTPTEDLTESQILASLSPRSRRRYKKTLHMRRKRGDSRTGMEKGRRGPKVKPSVPSSGRGRGRPRTRLGRGRGGRSVGGRKSRGGDEEEDEDEDMVQDNEDDDEEDQVELEEEALPPSATTFDPDAPPSTAPPLSTSSRKRKLPGAAAPPITSVTPPLQTATTTMLTPTSLTPFTVFSTTGANSTKRQIEAQAQGNCARANAMIKPFPTQTAVQRSKQTTIHEDPAPRVHRHVKPSGPTPLFRAQRTLDALRVTADYLVGEGLGLFHLGRVGEMVNLHYALNSPLTSSHLTSDTSVGLSAPALRVMEALVVDFVEGVVQAAVVNREMEGAQKRSAVWNLGKSKAKSKGKARSRSRSEKREEGVPDDDDEEDEEEYPVEDNVQRVTRTNLLNALDKVGVTHEERTRKGYFKRLIDRLRERRDAGVFDDDEEKLVFFDDDDDDDDGDEDEDEDEEEDDPSPQTDTQLLPIMHPLPVSLSSLFERSLSYTTPLLRPITTGRTQGQSHSQPSYSQARPQGGIELDLMDAETDEEELGAELEEEEELDALDQEEAEEEENGLWDVGEGVDGFVSTH